MVYFTGGNSYVVTVNADKLSINLCRVTYYRSQMVMSLLYIFCFECVHKNCDGS